MSRVAPSEYRAPAVAAAPAEHLIWPHGDGSVALEHAAAEAGHTATFYGPEGLTSVHANPMQIGRINAGSGLLTLDAFVALLHRAGWR